MYPHERSLVQKLEGKPFALLGINSDQDREQTKQVTVKEQMTWRNWWDGGSTQGPIQTAYNVSHWPTLYLLDANGVIRYIDARDQQLEEAVDKLMAEISSAGRQ